MATCWLTSADPVAQRDLSHCVQMCLSDVNVLDAAVDKSVIELVDHIWTEATGHLDDVLSVPASSITSEQVAHSDVMQQQQHSFNSLLLFVVLVLY